MEKFNLYWFRAKGMMTHIHTHAKYRKWKEQTKKVHHDIDIEWKFYKVFLHFSLSFSFKLGMKYANGSDEHIKAKTVFIYRYLKPFMRSLNYLYAVLRDHCCYTTLHSMCNVHNEMWNCKMAKLQMQKWKKIIKTINPLS